MAVKKLSLDLTNTKSFIDNNAYQEALSKAIICKDAVDAKTGAGNDYLGWVELPNEISAEHIADINATAEKIKKQSEVFVVIGIGGSYLGSKAVIEGLSHSFRNNLPKEERDGPEIYFAGINLSGKYLSDLIQIIGDRDFSVNIISKSGTTTEPAISFRVLKTKLEEKYGKAGAKERIIATTDKARGALRQLADKEGYKTYVIPDDVGGRYSVLTPVGLLPIACAGIDIEQLVVGAKEAAVDFKSDDNICLEYAALRNVLYDGEKAIEMLVSYEPALTFLAEWWKQLYGESEGKEGKGIFPASANFTCDLHSLGQYIQEGQRHIFETVLNVVDSAQDIIIEEDEANLDGLNYLARKGINYVNSKAQEGTIMAHVDGGVPNIILNIPEMNAYHMGYLIYFFEKACAVSGYVLDVNPFDQPGVEAYKSNMFLLLGKPK